jgi:hypothetical protein
VKKFTDTIQDVYGNAIPRASVAIYETGTSDLATLYEDDESTEVNNPLISDATGFVGAMIPNGKYDITITHRGQTKTITGYVAYDPADGGGGGGAGQEVTASIGTVVTCNTSFPFDDTIPQNTEGTEVITVTIDPADGSSDIEIEYVVAGSVTAGMFVGAAVFNDSDTDALSGSVSMEQTTGANQKFQLSWKFRIAAGGTSARTYKLRVGPSTGGTAYVNGDSSGARLFGGNLKAIITAREIA